MPRASIRLAFKTANVSKGAAIAIATNEMNSLVVMDFMRLRSPLGFSLSRRNVARDVLALNKRRAMGFGTRKGWRLRCFNSLWRSTLSPTVYKIALRSDHRLLERRRFSPFAYELRVVAAGLQPRRAIIRAGYT